jgi:BirA family biotin operon repressor/biotin-[acetyl-CoA-carboxylase] ligase
VDYRALVEQVTRHRREGPENVVVFERVDSTNLAARRIAEEYGGDDSAPPPILLVALAQERGRGRHGRVWESPVGLGVYATLVVPRVRRDALATLPLLVACGLCRALQAHLARPCRLKWPNDLVVEGRKLGGVLIESQLRGQGEGIEEGAVVVGFGVNHGQGAGELPPGATSLRAEGGPLPLLGALVWELAAAVGRELGRLGDVDYAVSQFEALAIHRRGDRVRCQIGGERVEGVFEGFDARGFLRLVAHGGERLVSAGEIIG